MKHIADEKSSNTDFDSLYRIGGIAALVAGVIFRRNIAAEIGLFIDRIPPTTVEDWFTLLHGNRLLGLAYLNIFDVVNYILVSLMFLALYVVLRRVNQSFMAIAVALGLLGIAVYFASNTAFSMLSLSDQYATAETETQKAMLLSAGEAMLAINRFSSPGAYPGTGGLISLFLIAAAGMITSVVMLRSDEFNRATPYTGILTNGFDLVYCIAFVFMPAAESELLAIIFIPIAGLFMMVWHILVGWRLYKSGR